MMRFGMNSIRQGALARRRLSIRYALALLVLAGCSTTKHPPLPPRSPVPPPSVERPSASAPTAPNDRTARSGGYYLDDGPGEAPPPDLERTPDAVPRAEPLHRFANQPYEVFGSTYTPLRALSNYRERGVASWYGRRFHGKPTASGEIYDMYQMSAAHPTLPIPSYARVTNLAKGKSVVVRVNDRGPFLHQRLIDLSYTAAFKLGYAERGSAQVEVELIDPSAPTAVPVAATAAPVTLSKTVETTPAADTQIFLQLGAFAAQASAESFRGYVARELGFLKSATQITAADGLYRVRAGPYTTLEQARAVAARVEREAQFSPRITP